MRELWMGIRKYLDTLAPGERPIRFAFLGLHREIRRTVERLDLAERIEDLGPQPQQRAAALLRGADAALIPLKALGTPASRGTIPAKLYLAVALSKPIVLLADSDGEAAALLTGYPHTFAPSGDPGAIAAALHRFGTEPDMSRDISPPSELICWTRRSATASLDRLIGELHPLFAAPEPVPRPMRSAGLVG
jgi:glycosyltransferase involved in cell wall biosynthesis